MAARPPPRSNLPLVVGLVGFTGLMAAVPVLLQRRHKNLQQGGTSLTSERPLSGNEVRRGVYLNTGSRDAGPDPDWDLRAGTYKGMKPAIIDDSTGLAPRGAPSARSAVAR
jgi:hypothetical protein